MYVCMFVYLCVMCMYFCMYECLYVCMHICMYVRSFLCMYASMSICMHVSMYICITYILCMSAFWRSTCLEKCFINVCLFAGLAVERFWCSNPGQGRNLALSILPCGVCCSQAFLRTTWGSVKRWRSSP